MMDINKRIQDLNAKKASERIVSCLKSIEKVLIENQMSLMEANICFDELLKKYRMESANKYIIKWEEKNGKG